MSDANRERAATLLLQLAKVAESAGMASLAADFRDSRVPKLRTGRFDLVVLGEFNHGKSTFVNALVGASVVPVGITPTTATLNHLVYAEQPYARVVMTSGEIRKIPLGELSDWVAVGGAHVAEVRYVEVGVSAPLLSRDVTLVDTPGVNDLSEQRAEITYGYVPRADAVLFLLDAGQLLKQSEREFLEQRVLERCRDRLVFVITKMDLLTPEESVEAIGYAQRELRRIVPEPVVFPVSSKRALAGERESSGIDPLLQHLDRMMQNDRTRLLVSSALSDGVRAAAFVGQNLAVKRNALSLDLADLESKIAEVQTHLSDTEKQLRALHAKIDKEAHALVLRSEDDLDLFADALAQSLQVQIDKVTPAELRRYLPVYIEDRFRLWVEAEGERLGTRLEALAEEIIQVTNQTVAEVSRSLSSRLGVTERLKIDVDSLHYDLSIFALGAFGTTIFLFVNTLVGGLLTLAAPVLAIFARGKVDADVVAQVKERAPEVVMRARDAMRPRLGGIVQEFVDKLHEFCDAAGASLYRGLAEVLDQALKERREQATSPAGADEAIARISANEAALDEVRQALETERTALWS